MTRPAIQTDLAPTNSFNLKNLQIDDNGTVITLGADLSKKKAPMVIVGEVTARLVASRFQIKAINTQDLRNTVLEFTSGPQDERTIRNFVSQLTADV